MTAYFDDMTKRVREASEASGKDDDRFIRALSDIENEVARDVSLCTGDREFPEDLRERAMAILATKTVAKRADLEPMALAVEEACQYRGSEMIDDLHSLFHVVAGRRIQTRFGLLMDSPRGNHERRDAHAKEHYST